MDAVSNRTGFVYDKLSRLTEETDPLGKKRQFTYDLAGNRTQAVDRNGRKRTFIYDALNRATQERWHDPATDAVLRTIASTYDRLDRVTDLSDPDATLNFTRQAVPDGPMLSARTTYPGLLRYGAPFDQNNRPVKSDHAVRIQRPLADDKGHGCSQPAIRFHIRSARPPVVANPGRFDHEFSIRRGRESDKADGLHGP